MVPYRPPDVVAPEPEGRGKRQRVGREAVAHDQPPAALPRAHVDGRIERDRGEAGGLADASRQKAIQGQIVAKSRTAPGLRQVIGIDQNQRASARASGPVQLLEHALYRLRRAERHGYGAADTLGGPFRVLQQVQQQVAVGGFHRGRLSARRQRRTVAAPRPAIDREQDSGKDEQAEDDAQLSRPSAGPGRRSSHGPVAAARTDRRIRAATWSASPLEVSINS